MRNRLSFIIPPPLYIPFPSSYILLYYTPSSIHILSILIYPPLYTPFPSSSILLHSPPLSSTLLHSHPPSTTLLHPPIFFSTLHHPPILSHHPSIPNITRPRTWYTEEAIFLLSYYLIFFIEFPLFIFTLYYVHFTYDRVDIMTNLWNPQFFITFFFEIVSV